MAYVSAGGGGGSTADIADITDTTATITAKTDNYTVLTTDGGIDSTLTMTNDNAKTFTLPSVAAGNVGLQYTFVKLGPGKLTIAAADSDIIGGSGAGGTVYDDEAGETHATITIQLANATKWVILGYHGTWVTT